jgi:hypothetical protein
MFTQNEKKRKKKCSAIQFLYFTGGGEKFSVVFEEYCSLVHCIHLPEKHMSIRIAWSTVSY